MRGLLLDTNTIRHWFDGDSGRFPSVRRAAETRSGAVPLYVSSITLGEIEYGFAASGGGEGRRSAYLDFVQQRLPMTLAVSEHTAEPYGQIRAALAVRFPPAGGWSKKKRAEQLFDPVAARELGIDENDLWIAAQAVERNLVLVTSDKMHRIAEVIRSVCPDFLSEDWAIGG